MRGRHALQLELSLTRVRHAPVVIFLWSRLAVWAGALFAFAWFEPNRNPRAATWDGPELHLLPWPFAVWGRWDSLWYLRIAQHGYTMKQETAFFPLYPAVVGGVGRVLGGRYMLAGILVALAACLGAFLLLYRLAEPRLGADGARRSVLYLAIFPTALFLQAVYSESLFLLFAIAAFVLALRRRWAAAGIVVGCALLTRSLGFALLPALAILAWRDRDRVRALASLTLALPVFAIFPLWLWLQRGHPLEFVGVQHIWNRHFSPYGPFGGIGEGVYRALQEAWHVIRLPHPTLYAPPPNGMNPFHQPMVDIANVAYLVLFVVLGVLAWRWFGAAFGVFVFAALAIPLSAPSSETPLLSLPRFGLVLFPIFLALAVVGRAPRVHNAIVAVSALLLGISVAQWALWQWVA